MYLQEYHGLLQHDNLITPPPFETQLPLSGSVFYAQEAFKNHMGKNLRPLNLFSFSSGLLTRFQGIWNQTQLAIHRKKKKKKLFLGSHEL